MCLITLWKTVLSTGSSHVVGVLQTKGAWLFTRLRAKPFRAIRMVQARKNPTTLSCFIALGGDRLGGDSILITLEEIEARLDTETLSLLKQKAFPFPFGMSSILVEQEQAAWIRYNREELSYYLRQHHLTLSERASSALEALNAVITELEETVPRYHLVNGECLVIDNKRVLHGRSELAKDSDRLLKRVRVYTT